MNTSLRKATKQRRVGTLRTKSGCAICRKRRIKCDEERPSYERCRASGWKCPVYTNAIESTQNSIVIPTHTLSPPGSAILTATIVYQLPYKVPGSQLDRQALHYLSVQGAADLRGFLPSEFWSRDVLQRCQHEVPVHRAAVALGRVHLEFASMSYGGSFTVSEDTDRAYGRATKALRRYISQRGAATDRDVVLTCCAILSCFELIRDRREAALQHLEGGLYILRELQGSKQSKERLNEQLIGVFAQMDLQATLYDDNRCPLMYQHDSLCYREVNENHTAFRTLSEAQSSFHEVDALCSRVHYKKWTIQA